MAAPCGNAEELAPRLLLQPFSLFHGLDKGICICIRQAAAGADGRLQRCEDCGWHVVGAARDEEVPSIFHSVPNNRRILFNQMLHVHLLTLVSREGREYFQTWFTPQTHARARARAHARAHNSYTAASSLESNVSVRVSVGTG